MENAEDEFANTVEDAIYCVENAKPLEEFLRLIKSSIGLS